MTQQVKIYKILFVIQDGSWDNWMIIFTCTNVVNNLPQCLHLLYIISKDVFISNAYLLDIYCNNI